MTRWQRRDFGLSDRLAEQRGGRIHFRRPRQKPNRFIRPLWWLIVLLIIIWMLYFYLKKFGM